MNKARDDTATTGRTAARGRYRVRDTGKAGNPVVGPGAEPRKPQRFVEPYRLDAAQRRAMLAPLERLGVGDDETRLLFAAALEYDLASCRDATDPATEPKDPEPAPKSVDDDLSAVHRTAKALAEQLKALDDKPKARLQRALKETDRLRRTYDDDYFGVLRYELLRLAAVSAPPRQPEPPAQPSAGPSAEPSFSDAAQRFITRAADAFEECFDTRATARVNGPFLLTMKAIATATGIQIPTAAGPIAKLLKTT